MNKKSWYKKISVGVTIIAGICTILTFVISLFTFSNDREKFVNNVVNSDNTKNNGDVNVNGDENITITGNVGGDININTNISSVPTTFSETNVLETEEPPQFNFGQAMRYIYDNEEVLQKEIINNEKINLYILQYTLELVIGIFQIKYD